MGFEFFERDYPTVHTSIGLAIAVCAVVETVVQPSFSVPVIVAAGVSLATPRAACARLGVGGAFPELRRVLGFGRLL